MNTKEAVLLNSGGIDSRVVAAMFTHREWKLHSLHILFNPENREPTLKAARRTAELYCVSHKEIDTQLNWVKKHIALPYTGMFIYMYGAIYASYLDVEFVFTGLRSDSIELDWLPNMQETIRHSRINKAVVFEAPLLGTSRISESIVKVKELSVPIDDAYSCTYYPPCRTCMKCKEREALGIDA